MDEYEAQALTEEILSDTTARMLGVSNAVTKQEHGVSVVVVTWKGASFSMKTPQQWRNHLGAGGHAPKRG